MNQNATGVSPQDEWHSVQGFALGNPAWADAPSVRLGSASQIMMWIGKDHFFTLRFWLKIFLFVAYLFLAGVAWAVDIEVLHVPQQIDSNLFQVRVNISGAGKNTTNFLRGNFYVPNTTKYFGYTQENNGNWYNGSDHTKYFLVNIDSSGSASATLWVKIDPASEYYKGSGTYGFKIRRYTNSGGYTWSGESLLSVNISTPTPSPSPSFFPTQAPLGTPLPLEIASDNTKNTKEDVQEEPAIVSVELSPFLLTDSPKVLGIKKEEQTQVNIASIASVSSATESVQAEKKQVVFKQEKSSSKFTAGLVIIGSGLILAAGAILATKIKKSKIYEQDS